MVRWADATRIIMSLSPSPLNEMVGLRLSSVEFVNDYIQFHFDGPSLTTLILPLIKSVSTEITAGDQQ